MSRRRRRRQTEKRRRPVAPEVAAFAERRGRPPSNPGQRLAYTRTQAAEALGISTSTFERRILPFIETVQMDWGKLFIPVDELERFLAVRRQLAKAAAAATRAPRPKARSPTRGRGPHPKRARARKESPPYRAGPQHGPGADIPGRPAVVAFDRARRSRPLESACVSSHWPRRDRAAGDPDRRTAPRLSRSSSRG